MYLFVFTANGRVLEDLGGQFGTHGEAWSGSMAAFAEFIQNLGAPPKGNTLYRLDVRSRIGIPLFAFELAAESFVDPPEIDHHAGLEAIPGL